MPAILRKMRKDSLRVVLFGSPLLPFIRTFIYRYVLSWRLDFARRHPLGACRGRPACVFSDWRFQSGKHQKSLLRLYAAAPDPEAFLEKLRRSI